MSQQSQIVFLTGFPSGGVAVVGELLGTSWPLNVDASTSGSLHLPQRPTFDFHHESHSTSPIEANELAAPALLDHASNLVEWWANRDLRWGRAYHRHPPSNRVMAAYCQHVVVEVSCDARSDSDRDAFVLTVCEALEHWIGEFAGWAEILTGVDLGDDPLPGAVGEPHRVDDFPFELGQDRAVDLPRVQRQQIAIAYIEPMPVDAAGWKDALERANEGESPAVSHLLLRDARAAFRRGSYRKAAIDAATACELALSGAIRDQLSSSASDDVEKLLSSMNGLLGLYRLHRAVVKPVTSVTTNALQTKVGDLRNRAAHAGVSPTEDELRESLSTVGRLVNEVAPLR